MKKKYYKVDEAAEFLDVTKKTVREWIKKRRLKADVGDVEGGVRVCTSMLATR